MSRKKENEQILSCIQNNSTEDLLKLLESSYKLQVCKVSGKPIALDVRDEDVATLTDLLKYVAENNTLPAPELVKECFRCLRNCTVLNKPVQNALSVREILEYTHTVFKKLLETEVNAALKMLLLFLTNLVVDNAESGKNVWEVFGNEFEALLKTGSFVGNVTALIYNLLVRNGDIELSTLLAAEILDLYENDEYAVFLTEHLLLNDCMVEHHKSLSTKHRVLTLQIAKDLIARDNADFLSTKYVSLLCDEFKRKSDCILKTVTDYLKDIEPHEVSLLLDVLASASSNDRLLGALQNDRSLLINCAFLLRSIHSAGKEGENNFTAIQKLSELSLEDESVSEHPAFGFKAALIRILGNLAWKCRPNQDELRELECIPLLLDCCNIDARNPFIIQCVIFAIRNLCERNVDNQAVIAQMNKRGVVESSTIKELGLTLHGDGESEIKIAPLLLKK